MSDRCDKRVWANGDMEACGRALPCTVHQGTPETPPGNVLVTMAVMKGHFEAAIPEARRLVDGAREGKIKPYENCIAFALALMAVCKGFGWKPDDFIDLVRQMERPPNG